MFYFLDAINSPTLCRVCLAASERASWQIADLPLGAFGATATLPPELAPPAPMKDRFLGLGSPYFPFFEEYLVDVNAALEQLPQSSAISALARRLRARAIQLWDGGDSTAALRIIRRLWARLGELELLPREGFATDPASPASRDALALDPDVESDLTSLGLPVAGVGEALAGEASESGAPLDAPSAPVAAPGRLTLRPTPTERGLEGSERMLPPPEGPR
jgi:hypothetical protein